MKPKSKKKFEFPNTFVIVFALIIIAAVATWFVPAGEYIPQEDGTMLYTQVEAAPQTWQVLSSLFKGFSAQAEIIIFILIIGGAFWIINSVKAMDAGIYSFLKFTSRLERFSLLKKIGVNNIILTLIILLFSTFGAVFGMSEETIAFTVLIIPLAISMGYDSITGVAIVYVAAHVGFAGAMLNPFTIGVAQNMAGLQMFSGIEYRTICWLVLNAVMITFILIYAARIKKNPQRSIMYEADALWRSEHSQKDSAPEVLKTKASWGAFAISAAAALLFSIFFGDRCTITLGSSIFHTPWLLPAASILYIIASYFSLRKNVRIFVLTMLGFTIVFLVIGVLGYSWYITEISALFLALGLLSAMAAGYTPNKTVQEFLAGAKDIFSAALIVGLASGIIIILREGRIIDTILHSLSSGLNEGTQMGSLSLMYGLQTLINVFIPSATAKAAITIPIMAPFSDLIGLSRQATVLAFQFGDGFTNMITPTSGVLMAVLGLAKIPYSKWVKWVWKFILILIIIGFLLLIPTVYLELKGF